jgi:glucokinase
MADDSALMEIVTADIGGTHARFAIASIQRGQIMSVSEPVLLQTGAFASFEDAWKAFEHRVGRRLPGDLSLGVAAPVANGEFSLTNSHWQFDRAQIASQLELSSVLMINDLAAVAHAISAVDDEQFAHVSGPDEPLPKTGAITIVGPGTGLGVALLVREGTQGYRVMETEGGHMDFASLDPVEDKLLAALREKFGRVSVERLVSGPGLLNIYEVLAKLEGHVELIRDESALWSKALDRTDQLAVLALDRFCMCLGAVAGDLALGHGASGVVIAGGIGKRIGERLGSSGFAKRFVAKGRFERRLSAIPVKLITCPEPGLLGAAVAFARKHA